MPEGGVYLTRQPCAFWRGSSSNISILLTDIEEDLHVLFHGSDGDVFKSSVGIFIACAINRSAYTPLVRFSCTISSGICISYYLAILTLF